MASDGDVTLAELRRLCREHNIPYQRKRKEDLLVALSVVPGLNVNTQRNETEQFTGPANEPVNGENSFDFKMINY